MAANWQTGVKCEREECERKGESLRHNTTQRMGVKGAKPRSTVLIHVFVCEAYGPQRTLHTHKTGPHGEKLEKLPEFAHYRFRDDVSGEVIETERRQVRRKFSTAGIEGMQKARIDHWSDSDKRRRTGERISQAVTAAWKDPIKGARMAEANRRKGADPKFRRRMKQAQKLALQDPVKRHRRSEGPRRARLTEREILRAAKAAQAKGAKSAAKGGAPAKWTIEKLDSAIVLYRRLHSWGRVAQQIIPAEWNKNQKAAADTVRQAVKYFLSHRKGEKTT